MWFFYDYNFLSTPLHQGLLEAESQIEPELKELLSKAGADEYAPIFAKKGVKMKQLTYMNDKQLSEVLLIIEKHMFIFITCAYTDMGSLIGNTQCENFRIILPLRFYVKSTLVIQRYQKTAIVTNWATLNFYYLELLNFSRV